jgi:murein DD-endopeptidase MepM/ murein hydrolase activator NlpD
MAQSEETKRIKNKLTDKYRLVIYNDNNLEEVGFLRLSRLNLLAIGAFVTLLLVIIVYVVIAFTPIREFIPGYPDGNMKRNIIMNALKVDSLEEQIEIRDQYFHTINSLISGKEPAPISKSADTSIKVQELNFSRSVEDSLFREQIEQEEKYNLALLGDRPKKKDFANIHFFTPVDGIVTNSFNPSDNHFGTDIVAGPNEVVKAVLDGTVIASDWTLETGYVIQIMHDYNLISIYKHNAEILRKVGEQVNAGESIAIIGNSGELTTGPHLHFEIWRNGKPLDPESFMIF